MTLHLCFDPDETKKMKNDNALRITLDLFIETINTSLMDMKSDIKDVRHQLKELDNKYDHKFTELHKKVDYYHAWVVGIGFTVLVSLFGTILNLVIRYNM